MPRYIEKSPTDPAGINGAVSLPYNLRGQDIFRMVEDLHDLLHDLNGMLHQRGFDRMEELLDPAGFSGFISRTIVDRVARLSRSLVRNTYHNGYPDLLPRGVYAGDSAQHGTQGGLEVKASRSQSSWQSHGPRGGWFIVVQFELDEDESKALQDREPTRILAVMVAELESEDWSWQPAQEGRIRSGTASIKPSGMRKLREGAAWVEPSYQAEHDDRLIRARREVWRERAESDCLNVIQAASEPMNATAVAEKIAPTIDVPPETIKSAVSAALRNLERSGQIRKPRRGYFST